MPAIRTDGFNVGVLPSVNFADPRLLAPQYSQILPGISQGLQVAEQFQGAPTRRQLAQIQLQQAQEQLAQAPIRQQLAQIQLAEAQKRAAIPEIIPGDVTLEDVVADADYPALDEAGVRTAPMPLGDLVKVQQGQRVGAGGVLEPFTQRTTLKTAAQRAAEAEKEAVQLEATRALADSRGRGKEYERTTLMNLIATTDDPQMKAMAEAGLARLNAAPGTLADGTKYQRAIEEQAAAAGVPIGIAAELVKTPEGAAALAKAATVNKAAGRSSLLVPSLSAEEKAILGGAGGRGPTAGATLAQGIDPDIAALLGGGGGAGGAPRSFGSVQEAQAWAAAEIAAGRNPVGAKITVGGVPGTWR